jgi:hypothetical protein
MGLGLGSWERVGSKLGANKEVFIFFEAPLATVQEIKASWTRAHKCKILTHLAFDNPPHHFNPPRLGVGGGRFKGK